MSFFLERIQALAAVAVTKGEALNAFEFWFNRYQTFIAALIALIAAGIASALVRAQLLEARHQNLQASLQHWRSRSVELDREMTLVLEITSGLQVFSEALKNYFDNPSPNGGAWPAQVAALRAAHAHMDAMIQRFVRDIGPLWGNEKVQSARAQCREKAQLFSVMSAEFVLATEPGRPVNPSEGDALADRLAPFKTAAFGAGTTIYDEIANERTRAGQRIREIERQLFP